MQLLHGDCLELMKDIPDKSVDMILCDPPYGIDYQSNRKPKSKRFPKILGDKSPFTKFIDEIPRIMKQSGCVFIFTRWSVQQIFIEAMKENGMNPQNVLIWDKIVHGMGDLKRSFGNRYESIIFYANKNFNFPNKDQLIL